MNFTELELLTLRDVWFTRQRRPGVSPDFHVRRIMREYSQKFNTPLHQVYDLPLDFVITAWLEDIYEEYKDEDLLKEAKSLTEKLEDILAQRRREDMTDADMWLFQRDIARSEKAAKKLEDAVRSVDQMTSMLKQAVRPLTHEERMMGGRMDRPVEMLNSRVVPGEKISIQFADLDLDAIDGFGLLDDPKP